MRWGRGIGARIVAIGLTLALIAIGTATAAGGPRAGSPDPSFGTTGRVVVPLPGAPVPSVFGRVVATADGHLLVSYVTEPDRSRYSTVIEKRESDGAPDPGFGEGGSVTVRGNVSALAEDPSGGIVYSGYGKIARLEPDGTPDKAFDANVPRLSGSFAATTIAFDAKGRIVIGGRVAQGARYHAHEGEAVVMRYEADGERDHAFGEDGRRYLGQNGESSGALGLLPDGTMLVAAGEVVHLSAAGSVLPSTGIELEEGPSSLVVFPDGSFAVATSPYFDPGCTVTRYGPGGAVDKGFGRAGAFTDPQLSDCDLAAAPGNGLLISGLIDLADERGTPKLQLLTAAGTPSASFGGGQAVTLPGPTRIGGATFTAGGGIVVAGGGEDATLTGLTAAGASDAAFGDAGTVVQPASLPSWTQPRAMTAEPDGELIVTGMTDSGRTQPHPFWMRFSADGTLQPTSSGAPFASIPEPRSELRPAGPRYVYAMLRGYPARIGKFERDGSPAEGFGKKGIAPLPHGFSPASFVVDPDGGITIFGATPLDEKGVGHRKVAAYRLTATGRPEAGFGRHGMVEFRPGRSLYSAARSGALLPGGDVVLAGPTDHGLLVAELGPDGRLRRGFGHGGIATCSCGRERAATARVVARGGHVYVLDHWSDLRGEGTSLVKVDAHGRLDRSFGPRGYRSIRVGTPIALLARGRRLLVVGERGYPTDVATVRAFHLDGTVDRSYRRGPSVEAGGMQGVSQISVAMQPNGRLVLAGERRAKKEIEGASLELLGLR